MEAMRLVLYLCALLEVEKRGDFPLIPSLPISGDDGETIMRSIGGQLANDDWQGSEDALLYRVGPGPGIVNLSYTGKHVIEKIQNVIGVIEGAEEPDRFVILGNHRDAWTFGAVDPNSGIAALLEVAQRLGKLQQKGWRPRRTIILCNWDAEEYGLIGSAEWVEENREMLASKVVAYLNVDSAVCGPTFYASATPQLDELLKQATQQRVWRRYKESVKAALQLREEWQNFVDHHDRLMTGPEISSSVLRPFLFFVMCLSTRHKRIQNRDRDCMERCFKILLESLNSADDETCLIEDATSLESKRLPFTYFLLSFYVLRLIYLALFVMAYERLNVLFVNCVIYF